MHLYVTLYGELNKEPSNGHFLIDADATSGHFASECHPFSYAYAVSTSDKNNILNIELTDVLRFSVCKAACP